MKKLFVGIISLLSFLFIFISCEPETPDYTPIDTSQYNSSVLWEGSKKISNWYASNDVILDISGIEPETMPEANALLIEYKSLRRPSFKIMEKTNWKNAMVEVIRGNGSLLDDDFGDGSTIELSPSKDYGSVICKFSEPVMENIRNDGFVIYGDGFTVTKISLTNDTSNEPGNVGHENPSKPPKELPNDIIVWDEGANFKDGNSIKIHFKNEENYSSNANAIRISFSTDSIADDGTAFAGIQMYNLGYDEEFNTKSEGLPKYEYTIGDGYFKTKGNEDQQGYIILNGKAKNGAIVIKIPDVYLQNYIKYGLELYNFSPNNNYSINKVSLTRLEEKTVFEGAQALSWDFETDLKLDIDPGKISADAKSIIVYFKRTYEINNDASCLSFNCRWKNGYNSIAVYNASGCDGFGFRFDDPNGMGADGKLYLNQCNETGISSCVFPSDNIKAFNERGLLILGQDIIITKVAYMYFSETGPTPNPTPVE